MFCYQCEQTAKQQGCTAFGVCGKDPETADMQDLLIHYVKQISKYALGLHENGADTREADVFVIEALFTTVTNVNFDKEDIAVMIRKAWEILKITKEEYLRLDIKGDINDNAVEPPEDIEGMLELASQYTLDKDVERLGEVRAGLYHLILYGIKGVAAYADHAHILGHDDSDLYQFFHSIMAFLDDDSHDNDTLLGKALEVGEKNITTMELLDKANTETYGHPEPTTVRITPKKGKAILVSGHDLKDLDALLKQTEGKDINVYTHGEMLPTLAYPKLKEYSHLAGNYGGAWQDQRKEFDAFPGAILMTTNCIQKPKESYKDRIFTTGLVGWPGVEHVDRDDFSPVIEKALAEEGFKEDGEEKYITVGFGRNAVLSVADTVLDHVKNGKIKNFFLIGGCDGAKPGRNYYTDFASHVPEDSVILTLACGKYRFNKMDFGEIEGIPRLLDIGQCNDAYSAIQIAVAIADALDTDVNSLPLHFILSWFEQKAVCILLSLLYLGITDIRLGPTLPAFIKAPVFEILQEKFNLMPVKTADEDLKDILGDDYTGELTAR